ncbi:DUF6628 family protein [Sphingomonas japonica]|nr:DUF6628 family protein [Sphingomonas japonica]
MTQHPSPTRFFSQSLTMLQPADPARRLLLFAIRQIGAHGLQEASAAQAMLTAFGKDFRRPLVLMRTFMFDMSQAAANPIQIAPWCCYRMTGGEATLLDILGRIEREPEIAAMLLADLIGVRDADSVAVTANLLASAFRDLGLPID